MKTYTHAWIAFKAIERLEHAFPSLDENQIYARELVSWFKHRKDGVIRGAWYPDSIIKDNATSHILKHRPCDTPNGGLKALPESMEIYKARQYSAVLQKGYEVDPADNLPQRCEALAHAAIDNLKVQQTENKGSPVAPTDNHVALLFFMLSHYVADAHMPLHCDNRRFSEGKDLHAEIEGAWEKEVARYFAIDKPNQRFLYGQDSYPLRKDDAGYGQSVLAAVADNLARRPFSLDYGRGNQNVMEYMYAVCLYSYLLSYSFVPSNCDNTVALADLKAGGPGLTFEQMSTLALSDAIDSVARVWLRVWRRYSQWRKQ